MFCRYALRTTDAPAGRKFYEDAIHLSLPDGAAADSMLEAWPLHERARAAGAPAHWLGQLAVDDLDACVERLLAEGAAQLGPKVQTPQGVRYGALRDPFGAVVALRESAPALGPLPVAFHQHHAIDAEAAAGLYGELFGFHHVRTVDVPDPQGGYQLFAFRAGEPPLVCMANTARWPGVHAQWLFYFPVPDVEAAIAHIRALGGTAYAPVTLDGKRLSVCQDPQGAAFGVVAL